MMMYIIILICVAVCVSGIVFAISTFVSNDKNAVQSRLENLTKNQGRGTTKADQPIGSLLSSPLDDVPNFIETFVSRFFNIRRYIDSAGMDMEPVKFLTMAVVIGTVLSFVYVIVSPFKILFPAVFAIGFVGPFVFLLFKAKRRLKKFGSQLPECLDLLGQALRAGQSLPAGIHLVAEQAAEPLGPEFARCYEEQNLGVALEKSLLSMADRIDNLDLRFFVTSVLLQRQTGGDLAEILDKISHLIRERFTIQGQIQALTGEGRLSGIVLLALPPVLFVAMLRLNYEYIMTLFRDPLGHKLLAIGIVLQFLGAVAIKKIITIKV